MSRYHPVRPKKDTHAHSAPQPAAPAQPAEEVKQRIEQSRAKFYELLDGPHLDGAIARWQRVLDLHDREAQAMLAAEPDPAKPHRWAVGPSMALRAEKHLDALKLRKKEIEDEAVRMAQEYVADFYAHMERKKAQEEASLRTTKQTPAPQADSRTPEAAASKTSNEGGPPAAQNGV
jgi:hypothetical protein